MRLLLCLALAASLVSRAGTESEDKKLDVFFRAHLEAVFKLRPVEATSLGEHRFDHQLDDLTPAARARWVEQTRSTQAQLPQRINRAHLSLAGQIDYDIFAHSLRYSLWQAEHFDPFVTDPRSYSQYISGSIFDLLAQSSLPPEVNLSNAIARIRLVPGVLAAARQSVSNPPSAHLETAIKQHQGSLAFYESGIYELAGRSRQLPQLRAAVAEILPALRDHQRFLEQELRTKAKGEWRLGRELFAQKLELELDAGLTADQVYADAQAEFARVRNDMYVIARQLWSRCYPREPLPPEDDAGRRVTIARV